MGAAVTVIRPSDLRKTTKMPSDYALSSSLYEFVLSCEPNQSRAANFTEKTAFVFRDLWPKAVGFLDFRASLGRRV